ncbi:MAG: type II toxin-antitoxin system HipA family toxin [Pseudomonadota bacterium]|nr:type II toxin-antitoxin system HipA family toxin [Pseudomonadota bacterium]
MSTHCTIELWHSGQWQAIATVQPQSASNTGWQTPCLTAYTLEHAIDYLDRRDAAALSAALPVQLNHLNTTTWPAFLVDLLPQGFGRRELLKQLNHSEHAEREADWPLLLAGAGHPIGHLRVREAADWLQQHADIPQQGFTRDEIASRSEQFMEKLAQYGLFVAGSSGVQGEWPKLLMTQAEDGLYYLDHSLPDHRAWQHWLIKFSRGRDPALAAIFQAEAAYMQLAHHLGLRVYATLEQQDRALFIPRFDRQITTAGVERLAQESIATLCGRAGFGIFLTHNQICQAIAEYCTTPQTEIIEYLKRDMANILLGNTDNHGRNTAIQRTWQGQIRLTPLYDFAPMWLHPEGIARQIRWQSDDAGAPNWSAVLQQITQATGLNPQPIQQQIKQDFYPRLLNLLPIMHQLGLSEQIIERTTHRLHDLCQQLEDW